MGPKSSKFDKHARKQQAKSDLPYIGVHKGEYYNIKNCTNLKVVATYSSQISGRSIIVLEHVCFFPLMFAANFPFQCSLGGLHTRWAAFLPYIPLIQNVLIFKNCMLISNSPKNPDLRRYHLCHLLHSYTSHPFCASHGHTRHVWVHFVVAGANKFKSDKPRNLTNLPFPPSLARSADA